MSRRAGAHWWLVALVAGSLVLEAGCSVRRFAARKIGNVLAAGGAVFASDEDPELVRDAAPFALKTFEALLAEVPDHLPLLLAACRGFAQYTHAFVGTDAIAAEEEDFSRWEMLRARGLRLYLRARDYGLRAIEVRYPGAAAALRTQPERVAQRLGPEDVELAYWLAASWGGAISLGRDRPELVADLPAVLALARRLLALEEAYGDGAVHELMLALEALPANMGGSLERAREHFRRAVELSGGKLASPYVNYAWSISVQEQDRDTFVRMLQQALAVDPDGVPQWRLHNRIAQRRARVLLQRVDSLFVE